MEGHTLMFTIEYRPDLQMEGQWVIYTRMYGGYCVLSMSCSSEASAEDWVRRHIPPPPKPSIPPPPKPSFWNRLWELL